VLSEEVHVVAVWNLIAKYGPTDVPSCDGQFGTFLKDRVSRADACATGVAIEEDDISLYDRLLPTVQKPDLVRVFEDLQAACHNYLAAFEACSN
jgi:hypothetical protein